MREPIQGAPFGTGSTRSAPEAASHLRPSGDDPLRERVRVILDCEWGGLQHALDMVIEAKPMFDRQPDRPGWGWHLGRLGKPALFVRRTKRGYSATADRRETNESPKGGNEVPSSDDSAEGNSPNPTATGPDRRIGSGGS